MSLYETWAQQICDDLEIDRALVDYDQLNGLVTHWAPPSVVLKAFESTPEEHWILFRDMGFEAVAKCLLDYGKEIFVLPIFMIEKDRVAGWQDHPDVQTFLGFLTPQRLGAIMVHEPQSFMCRGFEVVLADLRPFFFSVPVHDVNDGKEGNDKKDAQSPVGAGF